MSKYLMRIVESSAQTCFSSLVNYTQRVGELQNLLLHHRWTESLILLILTINMPCAISRWSTNLKTHTRARKKNENKNISRPTCT